MRILHLAYEDPQQPGSGGGSVRTREINRRLSQRHEITALVAGYPGAAPRIEDGIRWIPIGIKTTSKLSQLSYFAVLGPMLRRHQFDLLVEDFGAPISVGFSPLFTRKPVIASVQWMFASEMRQKYHIPFDWIERAGLPLYHDFISVSDWLKDVILKARPDAKVETIPNGIEEIAFQVEAMPPQHLLFVGRLDNEQKGCDLLLEATALLRDRLGDKMPPLLIVGDGPDRAKLENQATDLNLGDIVNFCGRIDGIEKYRLMASAYATLMPSRFETFGMVAVESQAAWSPLVTFDVGPLAAVAGPGGARLVKPFDIGQFTEEVTAVVQSPTLFNQLRQLGRNWAKQYDWNAIARQQESHYELSLSNAKLH